MLLEAQRRFAHVQLGHGSGGLGGGGCLIVRHGWENVGAAWV